MSCIYLLDRGSTAVTPAENNLNRSSYEQNLNILHRITIDLNCIFTFKTIDICKISIDLIKDI